MLNKILFLITAALLIFGCSSDDSKKTINNNDQSQKNLDEIMQLEPNEKLVATIETNMGRIELELFDKAAPKTVKNFVGLIEQGYYDGIIFHRVIDDFMLQGGDPTGTGGGGQSIYGSTFEDEFSPSLKHDKPGILSMANRGPNTNGSQFFITLVPTPWLDGKHTIFGRVIGGMDVVNAIGKVPVSPQNSKPLSDVVMEKVTVKKINKNN